MKGDASMGPSNNDGITWRDRFLPVAIIVACVLGWLMFLSYYPRLFFSSTERRITARMAQEYDDQVEAAYDALVSQYEYDLENYSATFEAYEAECRDYEAYMAAFNEEAEEYEQSYEVAVAQYEADLSAYNDAVAARDAAYVAAYEEAELVLLRDGINFTVSASNVMNHNNHVGNEWSTSYSVNGYSISGSTTVKIKLGSSVRVSSTKTERDSIPDVGSNSSSYTPTRSDFQSGFELQHSVTVRENRGRYSGNTASFTFTYKFVPEAYTVTIDASKLPPVPAMPTEPTYAPPQTTKEQPVEPKEPIAPQKSDVNLAEPDYDAIVITSSDVYAENRSVLIVAVVATVGLIMLIVMEIRRLRWVAQCAKEEALQRTIKLYQDEFYTPEIVPAPRYHFNVSSIFANEEEKRINLRYFAFLHLLDEIMIAEHHLKFLIEKAGSPYLPYDEEASRQIQPLLHQAEETVASLKQRLTDMPDPLRHLNPVNQTLLPSIDLAVGKKFTRKAPNTELERFFSGSTVSYLAGAKDEVLVLTGCYGLLYEHKKLRFKLVPFSQVKVDLVHGQTHQSKYITREEADILKITWLHMTRAGLPDKRYSSNPATFYIYDGRITIKFGSTSCYANYTKKAVAERVLASITGYIEQWSEKTNPTIAAMLDLKSNEGQIDMSHSIYGFLERPADDPTGEDELGVES